VLVLLLVIDRFEKEDFEHEHEHDYESGEK